MHERSELAELRVAQEVTARNLARVAPQIEALDARTSETQAGMRSLSDDITRLTRRTDAVDTFVSYLRRKLEADGRPRLVHTVRGVGFVLREETS